MQLRHPLADEGLGRGDDDFAGRHPHRQDAEAPGIGARHDLGDAGEIDLQWVDVQVVEADPAGQPFGQRLKRQQARRGAAASPFLVGDDDQRVHLVAVQAALRLQRLGHSALDQAVGDHPVEHFGKGEAVLAGVHSVHAGNYSMPTVTLCNRPGRRLHSLTICPCHACGTQD